MDFTLEFDDLTLAQQRIATEQLKRFLTAYLAELGGSTTDPAAVATPPASSDNNAGTVGTLPPRPRRR
jgi:hypothetical protein